MIKPSKSPKQNLFQQFESANSSEKFILFNLNNLTKESRRNKSEHRVNNIIMYECFVNEVTIVVYNETMIKKKDWKVTSGDVFSYSVIILFLLQPSKMKLRTNVRFFPSCAHGYAYCTPTQTIHSNNLWNKQCL